MWSTARHVAPGDLVIIWLTRDLIQPLLVTPGKDFNSKYGNYRHADFLGIPYGSKVPSKSGKGFIHILRPTPELWTMALPHRTQILYLADIAFITAHLNITRGTRVIEAGTGSASFSHSVARTIGSSGHLWSYEFHEVRASKAREEFARHGIDDIVTLTHRNVCKDGFTVSDTVDSVFLDLPAPWEAVEHAKNALRKDRTTRICCFSPCMEQVLRTVNALNSAGFTDITMYETLLRPIDVSHVPTLPPVSEISEKLKQAERKREEKRLKQIAAGKRQQQHHSKRKRSEDPADVAVEPQDHHQEAQHQEAVASKRIKTDDEDEIGADHPHCRHGAQHNGDDDDVLVASEAPHEEEVQAMDLDPDAISTAPVPGLSPISAAAASSSGPTPTPPPPPTKISVSKALSEVRGHTSYLTFASLQPFPGSLAEVASQQPLPSDEAVAG